MPILDAFMDGFTSAGLFAKLSWPGAPTEFIDSRSAEEFDSRAEAEAFSRSLDTLPREKLILRKHIANAANNLRDAGHKART